MPACAYSKCDSATHARTQHTCTPSFKQHLYHVVTKLRLHCRNSESHAFQFPMMHDTNQTWQTLDHSWAGLWIWIFGRQPKGRGSQTCTRIWLRLCAGPPFQVCPAQLFDSASTTFDLYRITLSECTHKHLGTVHEWHPRKTNAPSQWLNTISGDGCSAHKNQVWLFKNPPDFTGMYSEPQTRTASYGGRALRHENNLILWL